ncbi:hypothetical protein PybrP1_010851 [[Pythium] brassicae (nom. inval.)]|nr:hypothetical protein PybrP1_010851 [[Pythium] brassicae (nom. inval.)]
MLARYEQTKPEELQVSAAIRKRNRTKFRWGTTAASKPSQRDSAASTALSKPTPPPRAKTTARRSSGRRSWVPAAARKPLHPLPPIVESELEGYTSGEDTSPSTDTSFASSTASSAHSSISLPTGSQYSFSSPESSFASAPPAPRKCASTGPGSGAFMPRIEYNLRKLLREVMGLDSVWASDHQVARHYAHIGWAVVRIEADGNCLFRAISDQLYDSEVYHRDIRRVHRACVSLPHIQRIIDFIQREGRTFQPFIATEASVESLAQYCERMQREGEWGGNPELFAAAKLFNIHIVVHQGPMRRVRIENGSTGSRSRNGAKPPPPYKTLHLLFKDDHYNSLRPPPQQQAPGERTAAAKHSTPPFSRPQQRQNQEAAPCCPTDAERTRRCSSEVSLKRLLGDELRANVEDADASVVVRRPTRMVFQRGRPGRFSFVSTASSTFSVGSSVCSSVRGDSMASAPSLQSPRKRAATALPSAADAVATATREGTSPPTAVIQDELDDDAGARVAFPRRLTFHRGVPKQPKHATAAC